MSQRQMGRAGLLAFGLALSAMGWAWQEEGADGAQTSLMDTASIARVVDCEGSAARRAVMAERWRAAVPGEALAPGEWLEVGTRGANALKLRLAGEVELVLGPGAQIELVDAGRIRLTRGDLLVDASRGGELQVDGPGSESSTVEARAVLRGRGKSLERLDRDPAWLTGYEAGTSTEALGSLLANVDGRNVPLTIGYHKVTVDVRDQIARTVIEESFVNHTSSVLEGVFYFPLPADASISGFGMWIGGELVQGDIVEKERAREIYEEILRQRRDPGLLEWTGGNIFKARVFPIGAEKRIRIAYTQVLPREGDSYRYRYGLRSEMLRTTPLERLEIKVDVNSARALATVDSPSHPCRVRAAENGARVEFSAESYSPERDFELVVGLAPSEEAITVVPHRRGDEGYFMLLLDAPQVDLEEAAGANSDEPLELLVLADTSGSMAADRMNQVRFIETLLSGLSERDRFDLATCDVDLRYAFESFEANTYENRERALRFLERREPLGWSDLELAFAGACERASENTHVVYIGDGVPTSGAADPALLAHELEGRYFGRGSFHAIVPGSSSEPVVLRALAALGGGSLRTIGSEGSRAASVAAFDLLKEITSPAITDLELSFDGLGVAAVYPERLPNLPTGGQQIVVGRYDPTQGEMAGRIVLTGLLGERELSFERAVVLPASDGEEAGNSFIPRMWARRHLDHLLDQGRAPKVRERIVALSEDYQIVTPYSSFLVLESDADRERFGVRKGFRMRDGEQFFAEGRESVRHELVSEQMRLARSWRQDLRERVLETVRGMDRGLTELLRHAQPLLGDYDSNLAALGYSGAPGGGSFTQSRGAGMRREISQSEAFFDDELQLGAGRQKQDGWENEGEERLGEEAPEAEADLAMESVSSPVARESKSMRLGYRGPADSLGRLDAGLVANAPASPRYRRLAAKVAGGSSYSYDAFGGLFPNPGSVRASDPTWIWPENVRALLHRLDRRDHMAASEHGWRFEIRSQRWDERGRESVTSARHLIGPDSWLALTAHVAGQIYGVDWVEGEERGSMLEGWRLGRVRERKEGDLESWSAPFGWHFGDRLRAFAGYQAKLVGEEDGRARIHLSMPADKHNVLELVIDVERAVLVEQTWLVDGEGAHGEILRDWVQVGGAWWPTTIQSWVREREAIFQTHIDVEALEPAALASLVTDELGRRADAILLGPNIIDVADAKQAVLADEAGLDERWALVRHFAATQRWDLALEHLQAIRTLESGKPGLAPIRLTYLQQERRREELRLLLQDVSRDLVERSGEAEYGLALQLLQYTGELNPGNETLVALEDLRPVFERHAAIVDAELPWVERHLQALAQLSRPEELLAARRDAAQRWPHVARLQVGYADQLAGRRQVDEALAWLENSELEHGPWNPWERVQLRKARAQILWNGYRLEQLVELLEGWKREPETALDADLNARLLSALVYLDREQAAQAYTDAWLAHAADAERDATAQAQLHAAIQHSLGQGYQLYHQRLSDTRTETLARVARTLMGHGDEGYEAGWILQNWRFRSSDAGQALLRELYEALEGEVSSMPAPRLLKIFGWLRGAGYQPDKGEAAWQALLARVFERWLEGEDESSRTALAQTVQGWGDHDLRVRYLRCVLAQSEGEAARVAAVAELFGQLLQSEWSQDVLDELLSLIHAWHSTEKELTQPSGLASRDQQRIVALLDLVDWIVGARSQSLLRERPDFESLDRRSLARHGREARADSQRFAASVLAPLETSLQPEELRAWATLDRLYLETKAGGKLAESWPDARALARREVTALIGEEQAGDVEIELRIRAARAVATCAYMTVFAEEAALEERWATLRAILNDLTGTDSALPDGQEWTRDLLIALDRADELERTLAEWFEGGEAFAKMRWGRDLALVMAERGRLAEAAETLEQIERLDELGSRDLQLLSDWYTALDRADQAREALLRSYEVLSENELANVVQQHANEVQRSGDGVPPELDPKVALQLATLMRKARDPQNRFSTLRQLYEATKDFRLLRCLPEGVIGHSAQGIYPFLKQVGSLAELIDEEATVDQVRAHLATLRETVKADVDRRALHLLEFQIVHRATRQSHGTERHVERALAALRAAFRGEWSTGEIPLMAEFLAMHGKLQPESLAAEQLRQLRELAGLARQDDERLAASSHLAHALWYHSQREAAARTLESALQERRSSFGGRLPQHAHTQLATLSTWLTSLGSYRRAESLWEGEIEVALAPQRPALRLQLFGLYRDAVLAGAELAAGRGDKLYAAVVASMRTELGDRRDEHHAGQVVALLCNLWQRAHSELRLKAAGADATAFAFQDLPGILDLYQYRGAQGSVGHVADCLGEVRDARTELEFLVTRAENEPRWLRLANQDFWPHQSWRLGDAIQASTSASGDLLGRALGLVLDELREDLRSREARNRSIYSERNHHFWSTKRADFRRMALAVAEERRASSAALAYVANYLYHGLSAKDEAVAILTDAHQRGILDLEGRDQLATYLQELERWQACLPLALGLVKDRPAEMRYRVMAMRAQFHTGHLEARTKSLHAAETWFREHGQWQEAAIATLAEGCLLSDLLEQAVRLFDDAIALHVRTAPRRGVGDGVLCTYYRKQSNAYAELGRTREAVDAACGAILSWGDHRSQRQQELENLVQVLDRARDLEGFVRDVDSELARGGLENPILRKALGQVYARRKAYGPASEQLQLALAAAPHDQETHRLLVESYDQMRKPSLALQAQFAWARSRGHELALWMALGQRFEDLENKEQAERAFTHLVEISAQESEGHRALAQLRESQKRWDEAVQSWRHVVRIRSREPAGWIELAEALIAAGRLEEAGEVVDHLSRFEWPSRFGDPRSQADALQRRINARG